MNMLDHLRLARRRWKIIAASTLLTIGAALVLALSATPQYASTARLFVSTPNSSNDQAYQGGLFSQARVKSYANLLTGEVMAKHVVARLELNESPRDLAAQVSAVATLDTVVLSITITDPLPDRATLLTQAYADEFVSYIKELETPEGEDNPPVKATIIDNATEADGAVSPKPLRNILLATVVGLLAGLVAAIIRDAADTAISSSVDLEIASNNAPILGSIHFDKTAHKNPVVTSLDRHAPRTEAFRVLRTNLQFINIDAHGKGRVFVITSALPGEGKSTIAVNLAITLAESGQSVFLLEGDLRRPRAIRYLGLEGSVGVTTVLVGRVELEDAIQHTAEGLEVLASGATPPNPVDLLQSNVMKRLITQLRLNYDIVIIDAPPLLPVADAAVLAAESDGAILVVHHGVTTREQVEGAVGRIESVGARLIGTVINMTPYSKRRGTRYGYTYGYRPEALATKIPDDSHSAAPAQT